MGRELVTLLEVFENLNPPSAARLATTFTAWIRTLRSSDSSSDKIFCNPTVKLVIWKEHEQRPSTKMVLKNNTLQIIYTTLLKECRISILHVFGLEMPKWRHGRIYSIKSISRHTSFKTLSHLQKFGKSIWVQFWKLKVRGIVQV